MLDPDLRTIVIVPPEDKTVVRAVVRGECAELRDRVRRGSNAHAARAAAVIVFAAVQQINVVILTHAVEFDAGVAADRGVHDSHPLHLARGARGRELRADKCCGRSTAICDICWPVMTLLCSPESRLNAYCVGFDGDGFLSAAELHLEVDTGAVADLKDEAFLLRDLESGGFGLGVVVTDFQFGKYVLS